MSKKLVTAPNEVESQLEGLGSFLIEICSDDKGENPEKSVHFGPGVVADGKETRLRKPKKKW
jgi:hypothetical protein